MQHIKQGDVEKLRGALEAEKDSLEEELSSYGRVQGESGEWRGASVGFEGEEPDPIDAADQIEELATNVPLVQELEERHKEVQEALENMENGNYGRCEECGEPIPLKRLEANPAARTCIAHTR